MRETTIIDSLLSVLLLLVILLSAACSSPASPAPIPALPTTTSPSPSVKDSGPRLRIHNAGEHDLKGLVVMFPESRIVFGDVPAGSTSEYQDAPKGVYNYAAYEYQAGDETALQYVRDWVGESPRLGTSYTYVLDYDPEREGLKIELVEVLADVN